MATVTRPDKPDYNIHAQRSGGDAQQRQLAEASRGEAMHTAAVTKGSRRHPARVGYSRYGITMRTDNSRIRTGERLCRKRGLSGCTGRYLMKGIQGYHSARIAEYGLIVAHVIKWHECPTGQRSCK